MLLEYRELHGDFDERTSCKAFCPACGKPHSLPLGYALPEAKRLLASLLEAGRVDLHLPDDQADPRLSTAPLFGEARGHMFGVLVCRDAQGRTGVLKAFSGQMNGVWNVPGWVPPLIDAEAMAAMCRGPERFIKSLTRRLADMAGDDPGRPRLLGLRRDVSRALMKDIHSLYQLPNFRGETRPMTEIVISKGGIPSGTGDCCAPKLIGYAARNGLTPLGLAEFYLGRENKSGTRRNGAVYAACAAKCGRILGHMLCGLEGA